MMAIPAEFSRTIICAVWAKIKATFKNLFIGAIRESGKPPLEKLVRGRVDFLLERGPRFGGPK